MTISIKKYINISISQIYLLISSYVLRKLSRDAWEANDKFLRK